MSPSKVAVLGASGNVGSQIVKHLHNHKIATLAVARNESKIPVYSYVTPVKGDAKNISELVPKLSGVKTLISALHFDVPTPEIVDLAKQIGADRVIIVGGAGSLHVSENGPLLIESPDFPPQFLEVAQAGLQALKDLQTIKDFDWLFISPPLNISNLPTTGNYRVGHDVLLFNENKLSQISYDDYALGLVDEVITPRYHQQRITIAE